MTTDVQAAPLFGKAPPKPNLTLRVGISGHRPKPDVFPVANFSFVQKRLREVFAAINGDLTKIAKSQSALYSDSAPRARLVSGLAEGADQMAVAAMPEGWTLDAILPLPTKIYEEDFQKSAIDGKTDVTLDFRKSLSSAQTQLALPNDIAPQARDAAYARLGGFLLRQIDVLIAVWDGKPEQGRGGTAEVVRAALAADIPVVWISAVADNYPRIVEGVERDGRVVAPEADCLQGSLTEVVESVVLLPETGDDEKCAQAAEPSPDAMVRLQAFLREPWPKPSRWLAYDLFKRLMEDKPLRWRIDPERPEDYVARWTPFVKDFPPAGQLEKRIDDVLLPRFAWADALALDYSHRYRATYFVTYLLAAAAVLVALSGLFLHGEGKESAIWLWLNSGHTGLEIIIILSIMFLVQLGRSRKWKERWMEYRALAELLAHVRFLAYLGEHGRTHRLSNLEAVPSVWFLWYLRATIREIGLPNAQLDGAYQRAVLTAVDQHVIVEQEKWHRSNAKALQRMNGALHDAGGKCFIATLSVLALLLPFSLLNAVEPPFFSERFFGDKLGHYLPIAGMLVTFIAAFFPALGSALAGIRETGDFGKVAERSTKTATALKELHRETARAKRELALDETGDTLLSTAEVLTEDLANWQTVYGHKRLELPA